MENRSHLSTLLIACGTALVVAALVLAGHEMSLAAADVRDHRAQSSGLLLRDSTIDRVTLLQWEPSSLAIAWASLVGGFVLIGTGILKASMAPPRSKPSRRDDFE